RTKPPAQPAPDSESIRLEVRAPQPEHDRRGRSESSARRLGRAVGMRVLFATHFFPPDHPGGTESYTLGLAKRLQHLGHDPVVICAEGWGTGDSWTPWHEDTVYEGIPVRRVHWNWELAPDPFVNLYDN